MPRQQTEIRHAATTDHRILRRPGAPVLGSGASGERARESIGGALVPFHGPRGEADELRRDQALAILRTDEGEGEQPNEAALRVAARDLKEAVRRHPDDVAAWEGLGLAAWRLGDAALGLSCFGEVLARQPHSEFSLTNVAMLHTALGRPEQALDHWQRVLKINPWMVRYHAELSHALARLGRWAECEARCRQTIARFPDSHRSRQLLIESLLAQGKLAQADAEFDKWLRFRPGDPRKLRSWFENHPLRRQGGR
jgi:tetratricopeptide (TPR) repeat protein